MAAPSPEVRAWRTAFLTLRDETLTSPARTPIPQLLQQLIFSQSLDLLSAAPDIPPHELASDLLFLFQLVAVNLHGAFPMIPTFTNLSRLMHDICVRVSLELSSSSWTIVLDSFGNLLECFIRRVPSPTDTLPNAIECLVTLRRIVSVYQRKCLPSDDILLVKFLLRVISSCDAELINSSRSISQRFGAEIGKRIPQNNSLWEVQAIAFTMLGDTISRVGPSFPADIWQSTIQVFRKVMDLLATMSILVEDNVMCRFYAPLLNCLHLVLMDPKGSLSGHVSSFVAALRMFFTYGVTGGTQLKCPVTGDREKEICSRGVKSLMEDPKRTDNGPYRPPHLRRRGSSSTKQTRGWGPHGFSDHESSLEFSSSDSDYSDSDGPTKDNSSFQKSKVRVAAIDCIQDLCRADSKSFTSQWVLLLPTSDVLQPRKFDATLMTCLLFDPYLKARIASASTLAVMLDGSSSIFLQVAEYKESSKCGSFTALSSSLGHILMQLHTGILYLIRHETHGRLLVSSFKILMLLISSTPYSRMPVELLPTVIASMQERIGEGFPFKNDQTGLLATSLSCLTVALTASPTSVQVKEMLLREISSGCLDPGKKSGVLFTLFQYSEQVSNPAVCFEALQALRAVSHNHPSIMISCWEKVSAVVYGFLRAAASEVPTRPWKGHAGNTIGFIGEKVITAAIKVLDECLRAISGFKGTEDLLDDKLQDAPFTSDFLRTKKVSSAPQYEQGSSENAIDDEYSACQSGIAEWSEAIEKHMPLVLQHTSSMVRAASVTCFAGITSPVFSSLLKEKQDFILYSLIYAAKHDEVSSVRSAACRAIGVISCFPQVGQSAEILNKFIPAVEINTRDSLAAVRITASWALANICDSVRHCIDDFPSKGSIGYNSDSQLALLTECALRLSKDGDKIKSNAVRALGNLSRFVRLNKISANENKTENTGLPSRTNSSKETSSSGDLEANHMCSSNTHQSDCLVDSRWFERTVQMLISCVTTGNVKVQWNVCHAFSNLFLNETLRLQDMDWAPSVFSILLLLLRDSSNFKIRIQAAVALAMPTSILEYGKSFSDVVQGLEHIIENLGLYQVSAPSSLKYRISLEKQLTSTMLHVLSFASSTDHGPLKDFLIKKAAFLEEWFKGLCLSLATGSTEPEVENNISTENQKKEMVCKALRSLVEVFKCRNHPAIAHKFENLEDSIR